MKLRAALRQSVELLCDTLFPPRCVACGRDREWWCANCRAAVESAPGELCPVCFFPQFSHTCSLASDLSGIAVTGFYHDRPLRSAIHALKYRGATKMLACIQEYMTSWCWVRAASIPWISYAKDLAVQPLLSSPVRTRARGYDQSMLLADVVAKSIVPSARIVHLLQRHDAHILAQATLESHKLRQANIRDCFSLLPGVDVPHAICLVDDVITSGSTMREAARVLKAAGAQRIYGFALAVGA